MLRWEVLLGIAAAAAAFWQQAKRFIEWVRSWVIVTRRTDWTTGRLLLSYCEATMKSSPTRSASYGSAFTFVRPLERIYRVMFQSLQGARQTFWRKRRPLWYSPLSQDNNKSGPGRDYQMEFSFLRSSYDWEKLLLEAADWEDACKHGLGKSSMRYRVYYHYGSLGSMGELLMATNRERQTNAIEAPGSDWNGPSSGTRLLRWSLEDVQGAPSVASMDNLSLRPELDALAQRLRFWHESQMWYQRHGVPWRRGCLLYGKPGTGKTSFARAIAEQLDLPVHVFDLAGMSNQDLKRAWREMMATSPCIALLEDLDAVFKGRTNVAQAASSMGSGITFDTLLNCIDGIERSDGMLLIVTTNNLDQLDPALTERPGRIDDTVEFKPLDHEGRVKMATRILESVEMAIDAAREGEKDSAAQFQERCFQIALKRRFDTESSAS